LEGLREIRRSVSAMRASPLDNCSLPEALSRVVEENRTAGLMVEMEVLGQARQLSPQAELTLYRAAQEGLTNVRKHSGSNNARLVLDFQASSKVTLKISDKGVGISKNVSGAVGFGLLGMRERAQLLGGEVRVHAEQDRGFELEIEAPS
jgi:signal transduction histidine kinase